MKTVKVKLRKGWNEIPADEISDWAAPLGAIVWGAQPQNNSSQSFFIYVYQPLNGGAKEECEACPGREIPPSKYKFAGYDCYGIYSRCHNYDFIIYRHFLQVEDYVVCIVTTGTHKQSRSISEWIEDHMTMGEEIPNNNANPMQGGIPLVPPPMLASMVDFTDIDFAKWVTRVPVRTSYFDYIVKASMTPATYPEELVKRVNLCYTQHGGYREIDYEQLSDKALDIINEEENRYIGYANEFVNPFGCRVRKILMTGFKNLQEEQTIPSDKLYDYLNTIIENSNAI